MTRHQVVSQQSSHSSESRQQLLMYVFFFITFYHNTRCLGPELKNSMVTVDYMANAAQRRSKIRICFIIKADVKCLANVA